jgi:hypothetical protein
MYFGLLISQQNHLHEFLGHYDNIVTSDSRGSIRFKAFLPCIAPLIQARRRSV